MKLHPPSLWQARRMLAMFQSKNTPFRDVPVILRAVVAGAKGRAAAPMAREERVGHYLLQTGRRTLTPRQARRADTKSRQLGELL
jgi:hypothetical protein